MSRSRAFRRQHAANQKKEREQKRKAAKEERRAQRRTLKEQEKTNGHREKDNEMSEPLITEPLAPVDLAEPLTFEQVRDLAVSRIPTMPPINRLSLAYDEWYKKWIEGYGYEEPPSARHSESEFKKWEYRNIGRPTKKAHRGRVAGYTVQTLDVCQHGTYSGRSTWLCECPLCVTAAQLNNLDRDAGLPPKEQRGSQHNLIMTIEPEELPWQLLKFYASRASDRIPEKLSLYIQKKGITGHYHIEPLGSYVFTADEKTEEEEETPVEEITNGHKPQLVEEMKTVPIDMPLRIVGHLDGVIWLNNGTAVTVEEDFLVLRTKDGIRLGAMLANVGQVGFEPTT